MTGAIAVHRGCGYRKAGGVYSECGFDKHGRPLEHFLIDPPQPLPLEAQRTLGVRPIGVALVADPNRPDVTHVFDWVGSTHYPNVADFVEEVRRFGMSRRLPHSLDYTKLSPESRHVLIHASAHIENPTPYHLARAQWLRQHPYCVKGRDDHSAVGPNDEPAYRAMCASLWWEDVQSGESLSPKDGAVIAAQAERRVRRTMPAFDYAAWAAPERDDGTHTRYTPAIFASFPISRIVVVTDPKGGTHEAAILRARGARGIPVEEEEA